MEKKRKKRTEDGEEPAVVVSPYFQKKRASGQGTEADLKQGGLPISEKILEMISRFTYTAGPMKEKKEVVPISRYNGEPKLSPYFRQKKSDNAVIADLKQGGLPISEKILEMISRFTYTAGLMKKKEEVVPISRYNGEPKLSPYFRQKKSDNDGNDGVVGGACGGSVGEKKPDDEKPQSRAKARPSGSAKAGNGVKVSPYFPKANDESPLPQSDGRARGNKGVNIKVSPYFQKAEDEAPQPQPQGKARAKKIRVSKKKADEEGEGTEAKTGNVVKVSPYFQKANDASPLSQSDGRARGKKAVNIRISPYFQKAEDEAPHPQRKATAKKIKVSKKNADEEGEGKEVKPKRKRRAYDRRSVLTAAEKRAEAYRRKSPDNTWQPPPSFHRLLQESHWHDPWRVLVICMLLNVTTGKQTSQYLDTLFKEYPNATKAAEASVETLETIIQYLGLKRKRARMIMRMSQEYLDETWTHVTQLHGVGKYGADAYAIFCTGKWKEVNPLDIKLRDYWEYLWWLEDRRLLK